MNATVIQMAEWKRRHDALPVSLFGAWIAYCNAVTRAWFNAFNPHL